MTKAEIASEIAKTTGIDKAAVVSVIEQFMEAPDVFTRLRRTVLLHVLRQREHQALAVVKDIDFLPLFLGEVQRQHHGADCDEGAERYHDNAEKPYLSERGLDVF